MTILEQLRAKKRAYNLPSTLTTSQDLWDLLNQYDLALENALLKLKNRSVEIKDLRYRNKEVKDLAEDMLQNLIEFESENVGFYGEKLKTL